MNKFGKFLKWFVIGLVVIFVGLVVYRTIYLFNQDKISAQVEKIHNTKLTLDDVMGKNLPPDPGAEADKTVAGIDANQNGIRDDVELAVFEKYPNSAKTRAVLLQYALALQMIFIQPSLNTTNSTEIVRELSRADTCLADTVSPRKSLNSSRTYSDLEKIDTYIDFVKNKQFNTKDREDIQNTFYKKVGSFSDLEEIPCDIKI